MSTDVKIPDWKLERYLLKELPAEEMIRLEQQIARDESLRSRLRDLKQSDRNIQQAYPSAWMRRQIQMKAEKEPKHTRPVLPRWTLTVVPAMAILLLVAIFPDIIENSDEGVVPSGIRLKGIQPSLQIFRKTESGSERLTEGKIVREHDLLQIAYLAAGHRFGMILSVDGRNTVTLHLPYNGNRSASLEQEGAVTLDFSYELDDAPNWERFYFITSEEPFEVDGVVRNIQRQLTQRSIPRDGSLNLTEHLNLMTILLRKDTPDE